MKRIQVLLVFSFFLSVVNIGLALNASDVATIDLSMAFCLHPKMSLFDFNRIGFYKVEFGLKEEEFNKKVLELRNSPPDSSKAIFETKKELEKLESLKSTLVYNESEKEDAKNNVLNIKEELEKQEVALKRKLHNLQFEIENFDLTCPEETIKIASEIEKDIFDAIDEVVKENNYAVVLNNTFPISYNYEKNYTNSEIYGQGIPGMNFMLFYSFLAKNNLTTPYDEYPPSTDLINWLELTRYPYAINMLPMKPYPLVLTGGKSILADVVKKVYDKYKVDKTVFSVVSSVIEKIEQLQNGKELEKKAQKHSHD